MATVTIALPEDRARKLPELANEVGVASDNLYFEETNHREDRDAWDR